MNGNRATGSLYVNGEMIAEDVEIQFELEAVPMAKFKVGDKVRIVDVGAILYGSDDYYNGMITEVTKIDSVGDIYLRSKHGDNGVYVGSDELHAIEHVDDHAERIAALEAEVAALKAQLADKPKQVVEFEFKPIIKTPNARRADVIKQARAFVADLGERAIGAEFNSDGNYLFNQCGTKLTFHVNSEKGVVTALAHGAVLDNTLRGKAFAKCAPGDVFNADIGRAIAAGRLYGVKVPAEFTNAPKPTEFAVGMRFRTEYELRVGNTGKVTGFARHVAGFYHDIMGGYIPFDKATIIDDTDAQYES